MSNWWDERGWRQIQTNLRQIDMKDIDADVYVSEMKSFNANVAMINAAGIIASYPTGLSFHFQSEYLTGDSLKKIISACHAEDIKVVARTDFSKIRRPIYDAHPEWAYVSPSGNVINYNGDIHACINGGYQQEYVLTILKELLTTLDFDGIFFNMGGYQVSDYSGNYHGICQCENCKRKFLQRFNLVLPQVEDMDDPVFRKYQVFKRETSAETKRMVDAFIHEIRPNMVIDKAYELGFGFIRQESNTAVDRALPHWQYNASDNSKWATSSYPFMKSSNTTVDFIDFPYRHVSVSPHQQKIRLAENIANGGDLDYYLIGRLDNHRDKSGYDGIKEMFAYHAENERLYLGRTSLAKIALVNAQREVNSSEYRGWFRFLTESHQLFDAPVMAVMDSIDLSKYETLILPDVKYMSEAVAAKIDVFVKAGGTLIASGQSSYWDQDYERRGRPALACLCIESVETIRNDMRSSCFEIQPEEKGEFPHLSASDLIYAEPEYIYCTYSDTTKSYFRLIPPHNYGPPERCYWDHIVDQPGFVVTPFGTGKAIYIPWLPGALFHRQGHTNTFDFAADLIEQIAGCSPVGGTLPAQVQVTHFASADRGATMVHLVNHTGHFGNTWYKPLTLTDLSVEVESDAAHVKSMRTGEEFEHKRVGDRLCIEVPKLELFEALLLESS